MLDGDELRLYELIWKRTIASQMADAQLMRTTSRSRPTARAATAHVFTASGKAIEFAGFLRAYVEGSDDPAAELERPGDAAAAAAASATWSAARRAPPALSCCAGSSRRGTRRSRPRATPRRRWSRSSRRKASAGPPPMRRPSTPSSAARLRVPAGQGARPELHGVRGDEAAARALRRVRGRGVHRGDGGGSSTRSPTASGTGCDFLREFYRGGGDGKPPGSSKVKSVGRQVDYPVMEVGDCPETRRADRGAHRPVRPVPAARRGRRRQHGLAARRSGAGRPRPCERAVALLKAKAAGPRRSAPTRRRASRCTCINGRFGPYVQLGESPGKGRKGRSRKRASLLVVRSARTRSRSRGRFSCSRCRGTWAATPTMASRSSPAPAASVPT